jgi:hypothetical protein
VGYVRTAGISTAARRSRRRALFVIGGLLTALLAAFFFSMAYVQGWFGLDEHDPAGDDPQVSAAPPPAVTPEQVVLNVYNGTDRAGLAGRAAAWVQERGFEVEDVANDPQEAEIPGPAVLRHGAAGLTRARLVAESLPQQVELVDDGRESETVDLVLGEAWEELPEGGEDEPADGEDGEDG